MIKTKIALAEMTWARIFPWIYLITFYIFAIPSYKPLYGY